MGNIVRIERGGQVPDDPADGSSTAFIGRLGERLRTRRKAAGLTVQQLADRSDVSRRMLTQVELGQANPSLVTVDRLARALGTTFAALAQDEGSAELSVHLPETLPRAWGSAAGSRATLQVATSLRPPAELWEWTLQPHDAYRAQPDPSGSQELFFVVEGQLTITVEDRPPVTLGPGASARLASDRQYAYENPTDEPVRFLRVVQLSS
jgi:transcriptional regulator with XRE-family HTH domain